MPAILRRTVFKGRHAPPLPKKSVVFLGPLPTRARMSRATFALSGDFPDRLLETRWETPSK